MPKFNLELFKTLISNFAYIHSKRRKLSMFTLFQKYQFAYRNKSELANNSPISFIFIILNVRAQEKLKIYFWGKVHFYFCPNNLTDTVASQKIEQFRNILFGNLEKKLNQ